MSDKLQACRDFRQRATQEALDKLEACRTFFTGAAPMKDTERLFHKLAEQWRKETAHLSLVIKKVTHPAYQRIIGLGLDAVPLILCELQRRPSNWFWALKAITGVDPAQSE